MTTRTISHADWLAEAIQRFGKDPLNWAFVCPACGHVATLRDWHNAGAGEGGWAFSCVGRYLKNPTRMFQKPGPCDYAGGGLIRLNPVTITFPDNATRETFEFAPTPPNMTTPLVLTPGELQESSDAKRH